MSRDAKQGAMQLVTRLRKPHRPRAKSASRCVGLALSPTKPVVPRAVAGRSVDDLKFSSAPDQQRGQPHRQYRGTHDLNWPIASLLLDNDPYRTTLPVLAPPARCAIYSGVSSLVPKLHT